VRNKISEKGKSTANGSIESRRTQDIDRLPQLSSTFVWRVINLGGFRVVERSKPKERAENLEGHGGEHDRGAGVSLQVMWLL
jgi:hypothetical protein